MKTLYTIEQIESNDTMYYTESKEDAFRTYKEKYSGDVYEVCEYIIKGELNEDDILENATLFARYNQELIDYLTND